MDLAGNINESSVTGMRYYLETNLTRTCPSKSIIIRIFFIICAFKIIQPGTEFRSRASGSQPWHLASTHPVPGPTWPWFLMAQACYHSLRSVFTQWPWYSGIEKWENIHWSNIYQRMFLRTLVLWDIPKKIGSCYQIIMGNNTYYTPFQMITIHIHILKALRRLLVKKMDNSMF